jgi:hypothetical protein
MNAMFKKLFYGGEGKLSGLKVGGAMIIISVAITNIPAAANAEGIQISLPNWVAMTAFALKYIGGIVAGAGARDLFDKFKK